MTTMTGPEKLLSSCTWSAWSDPEHERFCEGAPTLIGIAAELLRGNIVALTPPGEPLPAIALSIRHEQPLILVYAATNHNRQSLYEALAVWLGDMLPATLALLTTPAEGEPN